MSAELVSGSVYVLGAYFQPVGPPVDYVLSVEPGPQVTNTPLKIDPANGTMTFVANAGEDALNGPRDVDYYPLDLTNGGSGGMVTITPLGLDGEIYGSLYRRTDSSHPWRIVHSAGDGSGGPVQLNLTPHTGKNLTDEEFMLSISTENFDGGPGGYQIQIAAGPVLAPTTITPAQATDLFTLKPVLPGRLGTDDSASVPVGQAKLYRFRAAETGTASLTVSSLASIVVSVYDETGTDLLDVFSGPSGSPVVRDISVVGGTAYHVRVEPKTILLPAPFSLSLRSSYTPQAVDISGGPANVATPVGPAVTGAAYRVETTSHDDVLVVQVETDSPAAHQVVIVGAGDGDQSPFLIETMVSADALVLPVDISAEVGPFDVFIQGTSSPANATIRVGAIAIPTTILKGTVADESVGTEVNWTFQRTTSGFGEMTGAQFLELQRETSPTEPLGSTLTAGGPAGARLPNGPVPILAHYQQVGSTLRLQSFAIADEMNQAAIEYPGNLVAQTLHAAIGFNASFTGAGEVAYDFEGEEPLFVGIQMVPDLYGQSPVVLRKPTPDPDQFVFAVRNVQLATELDRDLWQTILPFNILNPTSYPVVTFKPSESSMEVLVTAKLGPTGTPIASKVMKYQDSTMALLFPGGDAFDFRNQTVQFVVEPVTGKLGNGIYTLEMTVASTDPFPYLAEEDALTFPGTNPSGISSCYGTLPAQYTGLNSPAIVDIVQDPTGFGSAVGSFQSQVLPSPVDFQVYRFWATTPGPMTVRTIGLPHVEGEVLVNTNFNLYREYIAPNNVPYLRHFDGAVSQGLGDWFPANRSQIDDQTYVNYFDAVGYVQTTPSSGNNFYLTDGGAYYVVVKNEQGTVGDYRIEVDTASFPLLGHAATYDLARIGNVVQLPWNTTTSTQATFSLPYVEDVERFVGYVPLQLPEFHDGTLQIVGQANSGWNLNLYDEFFAEVPGTVEHVVGSPSHTAGNFTIPSGVQRFYLRVHEWAENPNAWTSLTVSTGLIQPFGIAAPPSTLPVLPEPRLLPTTPAGDTSAPFTDSMTTSNQTRQYGFQSQGGYLTVRILPEEDAMGVRDVELAWGLYVNGQLTSWNHTLNGLPHGESELQVFLPGIRPPVDPTDYDYDRGPYYDVVVRVQTLSSPSNGGDFSITVDSSSDLPMRNEDLVLPPTQVFSSATAIKNANDWTRFLVPNGASALSLDVDLQNGIDPGGLVYFAEVYGHDGTLVYSQTMASDPINIGATFALASLEQGQGYFLRTGYRADVSEPVMVQLSAGLFKNLPGNGFNEPPLTANPVNYGRAPIDPRGHWEDINFFAPNNEPIHTVFWAGASGQATFSADLGTLNDHYLALYRFGRTCDEFCTYTENLVDFANGANFANGMYTLTTFLETGSYALRAVRFGEAGSAPYTIDIPEYTTEYVTLEPNSGQNQSLAMKSVSDARDGFGQPSRLYPGPGTGPEQIPEGFRSSVYSVFSPPGTQGDVTVNVTDLDGLAVGSTLFARFYRETPSVLFPHSLSVDPSAAEKLTVTYGSAVPSLEYWAVVDRKLVQSTDLLPSPVGTDFFFVVPEAGVPDLLVEPLTLSPDSGQTSVGVTIRNRGFASAPTTHSLFEFTDHSAAGPYTTEHIILENALGPRTSRPRILKWVPNSKSDTVAYTTDFDEWLPELDEANNAANDTIYRVDKHSPVVTMTLGNPTIDPVGLGADGVFGRYISHVYGLTTDVMIGVTDGDVPPNADPSTHLYKTEGSIPMRNQQFDAPMGLFFSMGNQSQMVLHDFDFGSLRPTRSTNPNEFRLMARDIYGLPSNVLVRQVQVQQYPGWLLPENSNQITFNAATKKYDIKFRNQLINVGPTSLTDLFGVTIPFVGDLQNRFLLEMGADATASLNPNEPVDASVYARAQIKVLGDEILNTIYVNGIQPPSNLVTISGTIDVNSLTLDTDYLDVTFEMDELPLFSFASPKIPLFAYGVPNVAAIQASLQFSFSASLESQVTLAMDLNTPPNQAATVGFASPTYIAANLDAGLSISGDITFLGMDLASLVGTIHLVVSPAYGLESPPSQLVPLNQFTSHDCAEVTGYMYGEIGAEVLGIEVYSFDLPSVQIPFPNGCNVVGHRPGDLGETITIPGGGDPVGELSLRAGPQLVIDPLSQDALFLQLVDVDPSLTGVRQNLTWSKRAGGVWSSLTNLADPTRHISDPVLAQTHGGSGVQSIALYNSIFSPGDPALLTRNQFMTGQDLRYRYFDGTGWSAEQPITADSVYDFDHAMAFNSTGQGAVAWVKNHAASPLDPQGRFDRSANEIQVAVWNPVTHAFASPQSLTSNAVGDGQPAVYTAADGRIYVLWIQDTGFDTTQHVVTSNQVMFSVFDPGTSTWSSAAPLAISGLPATGIIDSLQIGSQGGDRVNVLVAHSQTDTDLRVTSRLFSRSSSLATFASPQPLAIVAENMNFSHLHITTAPDGGLVAYWMAGNGQTTEVTASRLGPVGNGPSLWSQPLALSSTDGNVFPMSPSLAVDANGEYQLVYEMRTAPVSTLTSIDPTFTFPRLEGHPDGDPPFEAPFGGGVGSSSYQALPEFGFLQPFAFSQEHAVAGLMAEGTAIVANRGLIGDLVRIDYVRQIGGAYAVLETDTVYLAPGGSYAAGFDFPVSNGTQVYGIRLTSNLGQEMIGVSDNLSTDELTGKRDIAVTAVTLSNPDPVAGETVTVDVEIQNLSNMDVGAFRVELYDRNPTWQFQTPNLIGSTIVNQLSAQQSVIRSFLWTVPADGGRLPLFAVADLGNSLDEVTHGNNRLSHLVQVLPEVAVQDVTASVLDFSGVDNVQIRTTVANLGKANAEDVTFSLYYSLDGSSFQFVDSLFFHSMAPGQMIPLTFLAPGLVGLTGENRYRVFTTYADQDPTNQLQQTLLILQGAADLTPSGAHLDTATPTQGEPATMIVDINNMGIATAQQLLVEVYGTNPDNTRYLLGSQIIAQMGPLSVTHLEIALETWRLRGLVEFCVEVDGPQEILELTDLNNSDCFRQDVSAVLPHDYGDAPETYPVRLADDGARHRRAEDATGAPLLGLGQLVDYELDGQPSAGNGDDTNGLADEDGVRFLNSLRQGSVVRVRVAVSGSVPGYLSGWFDFDGNDSWQEAGERIFTDVAVMPGVHDLSFVMPAAAATGATYARFRLSTAAELSATGPAPDGEVEDYRVVVRRPKPPVTSFSRDNLQRPATQGGPASGELSHASEAMVPRNGRVEFTSVAMMAWPIASRWQSFESTTTLASIDPCAANGPATPVILAEKYRKCAFVDGSIAVQGSIDRGSLKQLSRDCEPEATWIDSVDTVFERLLQLGRVGHACSAQ